MLSGALGKQSLLNRINSSVPLISEYLDLSAQIQQNGFDCTLRQIEVFKTPARIGTDNVDRQLPDTETLFPDTDGYYGLDTGPYLVTLNEIVNIPNNLMALAKPRSSLLRSGISIHTAIWDAGYSGRSQCLMVNNTGSRFQIKQDSRILQMVFLYLDSNVQEGYSGIYQHENTG